jgi:nickel/cobalt exporter
MKVKFISRPSHDYEDVLGEEHEREPEEHEHEHEHEHQHEHEHERELNHDAGPKARLPPAADLQAFQPA